MIFARAPSQYQRSEGDYGDCHIHHVLERDASFGERELDRSRARLRAFQSKRVFSHMGRASNQFRKTTNGENYERSDAPACCAGCAAASHPLELMPPSGALSTGSAAKFILLPAFIRCLSGITGGPMWTNSFSGRPILRVPHETGNVNRKEGGLPQAHLLTCLLNGCTVSSDGPWMESGRLPRANPVH